MSDASGGDQLPDWLYWNASSNTVYGVPSNVDIGHVYVQVTATTINATVAHTPTLTDVFDVHVRDETPTNSAKQCAMHQPTLFAAVLFDTNIVSWSASQRVRLIEHTAQHLSLDASKLRLYSTDYDAQVYERRLLMANAATSSNTIIEPIATHTTILFWPIGCGTAVDDESIDAIETLESSITSGKLSTAIGHSLIGWQV